MAEVNPQIPSRFRGGRRQTADGEFFTLTSDRWTLDGDGRVSHIKWEDISSVFSQDLLFSAKETAAGLLLSSKVRTVENQVDALRRLASFLGESDGAVSAITGDDIERFFADRGRRGDSALRPFLQHWRTQGLSGLDESAWCAIKDRRFKSPDQSHITTLDPEKGPYLDAEMIAADLALRSALESGDLCDERYLSAMVFRLYGQRPIMVANLKCGDVRTPRHDDVQQSEIRFPLAKKKQGRPSHGPARPTPMLFSRVLERYLDQRYDGVDEATRHALPLFPAQSPAWSGRWSNVPAKKTGRSHGEFAGHCTANTMAGRYKNVMDDLKITSPRTGKPLVFNPMRERHTIGTLLAMKGCSAHEIAAWLHHDDLGSCEAYVELGTRHHQLMHSMLDGRFTHLAGRFLGEIIPQDALDDVEPDALIPNAGQANHQSLGGCAAGGCKALDELAAPYACLDGCPNLRLSIHADLRPLIKDLANRKSDAKAQGQSEYHEALNRHLAQAVAAERALQAERGEITRGDA